MKRIAFFCAFFLLSLSLVEAATPKFSVPAVRFAYLKVDKKIQRIILPLTGDKKKFSEEKRQAILTSFLSLDVSVKQKNRAQGKAHIASIKRDFKDLILGVKTGAPSVSNTPSSTQVAAVTSPMPDVSTNAVDALYYADIFEWRGTANGNIFSHAYFSSAKCSTPFNALVQVMYGNRSVIVKNNDRPNCDKHADIIDLTKTAFEKLAPLSKGRLSASYTELGWVDKNYYKRYLATDFFNDLQVRLDSNIPNSYLKNDTIRISGYVTDGNADTIFFLQSPSGKNVSMSLKAEDGKFEYFYPLSEVGSYKMVVSSGMGFSTNNFMEIVVQEPVAFSGKKLVPATKQFSKPESLDFERIEFSDLKGINLLKFPTKDYYTITLKQDGKTLSAGGIGTIAFIPGSFDGFNPDRDIAVEVTGAETVTGFSHDAFTIPVDIYSGVMKGVSSYKTDKKENISVSVSGNILTIRGFIGANARLRPSIYLISPNGSVITTTFDASAIDSNGLLKTGTVISKNIALETPGQYLVEVNYDTWFAAFNGPVSYGSVLPLFKNEYDGLDAALVSDITNASNHSLDAINELRKKTGKSPLVLDSKLMSLALAKAQDMADKNYLAHVDSFGERIDGTARRAGISITGRLGENIAGGNVHYRILIVGLANSGWHRENMLGDWKKLGVATVIQNNRVYYVQVFGD